MTVNLRKSKFMKQQAKFLGHKLTIKGIRPDPEKIEAITQFPVPTNIKRLRGFLGLCNFCRRFYDNYAATTHVLLKLLQKGVPWTWGEEEKLAFEEVKRAFLESVLLHHSQHRKRYYLQTDSSDVGLGSFCVKWMTTAIKIS